MVRIVHLGKIYLLFITFWSGHYLADIPKWIFPQVSRIWRIGRGKKAFKPLPWQVRLRIDGREYCGGTIVDHKTVITAAHCVDNRPDGEGVTIHAGSVNVEEFPQVS